MKLRWLQHLATVCTVAGAAGCATPPQPVPDDDAALSGRLSVQVAGDAARAVSAGFELTGNAQRGSLVLSGPLGTTAARASWSPGEAVLETGGRRSRHADLDSLGAAALCEGLPMAALFDWLRGRPWPGAATQPRSDGSAGFMQLGWQIDLSQWSAGTVQAVRSMPPAITVRARVEQAE